jgi:hypothetical protein
VVKETPMGLLELIFNAMYRAAEDDPLARKLLVAAAAGYNEQMARINGAGAVPVEGEGETG